LDRFKFIYERFRKFVGYLVQIGKTTLSDNLEITSFEVVAHHLPGESEIVHKGAQPRQPTSGL